MKFVLDYNFQEYLDFVFPGWWKFGCTCQLLREENPKDTKKGNQTAHFLKKAKILFLFILCLYLYVETK